MTQEILGKSYDSTPYKEVEAAATITPGVVLERTGVSNGNQQVQPVSSVDPDKPGTLVAREQRHPPRSSSGDPVDQDYASGDNVEAYQLQKGEEANLRLAAGADLTTASNATVSVGDKLGVNDDGTLKAGGSGAALQFRALEANDNSGASSGSNPLIKVEVL